MVIFNLKAFFGIFTVIMVKSDALQCAVKVGASEINSANSLAAIIPEMNKYVTYRQQCNGRCAYRNFSESQPGQETGNYEIAGCQKIPSDSTTFAMNNGAVKLDALTCRADFCNSPDHPIYAKMMRISKHVEEAVGKIDGSRSPNLQCYHGDSYQSCPNGWCAISDTYGTVRSPTTVYRCIYDFQKYNHAVMALVVTYADEKEKVMNTVFCSTNNCNAPGSTAEYILRTLFVEAKNSQALAVPLTFTIMLTILQI